MRNRVAAGLVLYLVSPPAWAATPFLMGTMCGWDASTSTCATGKFDQSYHYVDDRKVRVFKPDAGVSVKNELVVFLHGCCADVNSDPTTAGNVDGDGFLSAATAAGYFAISLDYFSDKDHPSPGGFTRDRCACDPDCYGYVLRQMWKGTPHDGMPTMDARESIEHRLVMVLRWLVAHDSATNWQQFLEGTGPNAEPHYVKIVMSGHSLGSNVAGYIAKHTKLARAVMLAGVGETLDVEPHWEQAAKTWSYQQITHIKCAKALKPSGWITDNHFGSNTGTAWKTPLDRIYSIRGACDDTMFVKDLANVTPFDPYMESTLKVWDTLALGTLGAYASVDTDAPPFGHAHGLTLGARDTSASPYACKPASLCGAGHSSMLGGSCGSSAGHDKLRRAWTYVLTE